MTPLIRFGFAWIMGIVTARWLELPWWPTLAIALLATVALFLYHQEPHLQHLAALFLVGSVGAFWFVFFQLVFNKHQLASYNDKPQSYQIVGLVVDEPDKRDNYINLRLQAETIQLNGLAKPIEGLVLVQAPRYPERSYGDRLTVTGQLETPPILHFGRSQTTDLCYNSLPQNQSGTPFSYQDYLAVRFGIYSMMRRPQITLLAHHQGYFFWEVMFAVKARVSQTINRLLAEPYAALLNGILLGVETGIPRQSYELFNLTGTSHIIVISGSNVSVVVAILLFLGQKLFGKQYAPPMAISGIIGYTILVGADPSVSRAAVMGSLYVFARWIGRPNMALNSLAVSAIFLTFLNPLILWDVGFQLSFMATLGLILLVPPLERLFFGLLQRILKTDQIGLSMALLNELLIVTLAAQISTGPLILYHFGRLSPVSLLTNLLILPAQPPIMIFGAMATLVGLIWLPLGQLLAWVVWLPLAWSVWIVQSTATWPYASLNFGAFPWWLMVLMYATIAAGIWWADKTNLEIPYFHLPQIGSPTTRLLLGAGLLISLLVGLAWLSLPDGRLHVAFLDVGQGDAILITTPTGRHMVIDGGPSATQLNCRLGQQLPFWKHSLDMVVNTHPDSDHLSGLVPLLDRYHIDQVLVTDVASGSSLYHEWQTKLEQYQLKPITATAGMKFSLGQGITATILSPGSASLEQPKINNHAIVMRLDMGAVSFLLPGDIETPIERNLVFSQAILTATVLKSPHHGSNSSSSEIFLEAVHPQWVVISVGQDNHFGEPNAQVLERYTQHGYAVLRTDEDGTIELVTDGQTITRHQ